MGSGKALVLMGARQVGKTTLLHQLLDGRDSVLWLSGDAPDVRAMLEGITSTRWRQLIGQNQVVVLDEAQRIEDIGVKLKLLIDNYPQVQLVATGSSSFDLANRINEPLTGRKWEYTLHPLSFAEMVAHHGLLEEKRHLPQRLVYGYYPDIVTHPHDARELLIGLSDSYLYKDIFTTDKVKKSDGIVRMLQALAYQVGSEVSFNEVAQLCSLAPKTVERYVAMLEQAYVLFRLPSYSRNLRNELKYSRKIYFYDNGIRNAVIGQFQPIETRPDAGALFENFAIAERLKRQQYARTGTSPWFWRTTARQEIDYLETDGSRLDAYELKLNPRRRATSPRSFANAYPDATFQRISLDNIEDFLL